MMPVTMKTCPLLELTECPAMSTIPDEWQGQGQGRRRLAVEALRQSCPSGVEKEV